VAPESAFRLPLQITSPVDVGRLLRELETIDGDLSQAELRHDGSAAKVPKTTSLMDQTMQLNKINLADTEHRQQLMAFLKNVKAKAPVLHISFSADPSTSFIEHLLTWLRTEIHPTVLLTIGLQPNIGAGCIVRSTNKYFDMSLRQDFLNKRGLLLEKLDAVMNLQTTTTPVSPSAAPAQVTAAIQAVEASRSVAPSAETVHTAPQAPVQQAAA
jgi:hypothetical protein